MESSGLMTKAHALLDSVRGRSLSVEERRELAIELAALILDESRRVQTAAEWRIQGQLDQMVNDPSGKCFVAAVTDQCFRTRNCARVADQLIYLLNKFGIPHFVTFERQLLIRLFKWLGKGLPDIFVPLFKGMLRMETARVVLPGEEKKLLRHIETRREEGVRINLNHIGEAVLGEEEAERRLQVYLDDLSKPDVHYISVKVSTIFSQINLIAWEETLQVLMERFRKLLQAASHFEYVRPDGKHERKFVNLDMEEYRDLHLTVELFCRVLDEPEFLPCSAGIVLQAYLPEAFHIQQKLTEWAKERVKRGGAPIKIRLVKGANLAMEKVEASLHGWPQAPYTTKGDTDANYKRMVSYGCAPENAPYVRIGIGSHNLFDIAYALLLRSENQVENAITFEMLEGMADHTRRVIQQLVGDILLYCPTATRQEFHNAVAYLMRRLDENTAPENFLCHAFGLMPDTPDWHLQSNYFSFSCHGANAVRTEPRRLQNRAEEDPKPEGNTPFHNEPDTDWSLPQNRLWGGDLLTEWSQKELKAVPAVINGREIHSDEALATGEDPSRPNLRYYSYTLTSGEQIDKALKTAQKTEKGWGALPTSERSALLAEVAAHFRHQRGELLGAMVADGGKTLYEADPEISEAIDFIEYYRRNREDLDQIPGVVWESKGTTVVAPPWNFPCSIPTGGIAAALAAGNCVLFKPAPQAVYVGWIIANLFWKAGVSKDVLQFIPCSDHPTANALVNDPRVACVILTGGTDTAQKLLQERPGLDLIGETGGKNTLILSNLCDRDLAVHDLVYSAFGHSGQKCSACSLAICLREVYENPSFRKQLKDAAASLRVGSAWCASTKINPLIQMPSPKLLRALTNLEEGEEWLLKPQQDPENPYLWSPGIKLGVKPGSFTYETELFGPLLGIMCVDTLDEAIHLANGTPYGLTAGIHSLDEREWRHWTQKIEAGNLYVNRSITGAIVQRQPFGGTKRSSFGPGAHAGGPNYLQQLMRPLETALPEEEESVKGSVNALTSFVETQLTHPEEKEIWEASIKSYAYHWAHFFSLDHDPSQVLGQDNILRYAPHKHLTVRVQEKDSLFDVMRIIAAALICQTPLEMSGSFEKLRPLADAEWLKLTPKIFISQEDEAGCTDRAKEKAFSRVRFLSEPGEELLAALAETGTTATCSPVMSSGRLELLNYVREVSLSVNYHRYGNLGERES